MIISVTCFAVINLFVKKLVEDGIPPHELVFFRSIISLVLSAGFILTLKNVPFFGNNKKWLLIRGLAGMTALTMFFYTVKNMPLVTATTIQYLSPFFTVLLAVFLNGQKLAKFRWLFFALAFLGVVLIKGFDPNIELKWLILGIGSAAISGLAYNAIIKCKETDHPITVVMYFPLVAAPVLGIWTFFNWISPNAIQWGYILIVGLLTQAAQVFMTKALQSERAATVMPLKYIGSIYAWGIGWLYFEETVPFLSMVGIVLVLSAVLANTVFKKRNVEEA